MISREVFLSVKIENKFRKYIKQRRGNIMGFLDTMLNIAGEVLDAATEYNREHFKSRG